MITVHDLEGTVTMTLSDYEKMRDRENKAQLEISAEWDELKVKKKKFDEGFIRKVISAPDQGLEIDNRPYMYHTYITEEVYITKDQAEKEMIRSYDRKIDKLKRQILDCKLMSVSSFKLWRKLNARQ